MTLSDSQARIGTVLGDKYELLRELGHGGMGVVYEARHKQIGRRVALKLLLPEHAADREVATRFATEARAAGALAHENVAAVYDVGSTDQGAPFIVMEYLEGQDCNDLLESLGRLSIERAIDVIVQVCRGLQAAHDRGIVHRDLKPANLFMTRRGDGSDLVKILDFGIAKLVDGSSTVHTGTGAAIGTAYYMSPEQARGETDVDHRTDVYALGVILYELLSGERPYQGDTLLQIVHRILEQKPVPLAERMPALPSGVCTVVHTAMAGRSEQRYASAHELAHALSLFVRVSLTPAPTVDQLPSGLALQATDYAPSEAPPPPVVQRAEPASASPKSSSNAVLEVTPRVSEPSSIGALLIVCVMLVALLGAALAWLLVREDLVRTTAEPSDVRVSAPAATVAPVAPAAPAAPTETRAVIPVELPTTTPGEPKPKPPAKRSQPSSARDKAEPLSPICARLLERQSLGDALDVQEQAQLKRQCRR